MSYDELSTAIDEAVELKKEARQKKEITGRTWLLVYCSGQHF